ncbi:MAG: hypothetical protein WCT11_00790 [Candidatus Magasanikbacteria bacterium]
MAAPRLVGSFSVQQPATPAPVTTTPPAAPTTVVTTQSAPATIQVASVLLWIAGILAAVVLIAILILTWVNVKTTATTDELARATKLINDNSDENGEVVVKATRGAIGTSETNVKQAITASETNVKKAITDDGNATRTAITTSETNVKQAITASETNVKKAITDDGNATRTDVKEARKALRWAIASRASKSDISTLETNMRASIKDSKLTVRIEDQRK